MKVYHLSSAPFFGGASRAGFRLHESLLKKHGLQSVWLNVGSSPGGTSVIDLRSTVSRSNLVRRFKRRNWSNILSKHFNSASLPSNNPIGWGTIEMLAALPQPDIWNLHWVSGFLNWEVMLPWMAESAPIVWTLHDLNPLRGVWHYDPKAEEVSRLQEALERKAVDLKAKALAKIPRDRLTFVGPSKWIKGCCEASGVAGDYDCVQIPYGIDTDVFKPRDRMAFRSVFGISSDSFVVGFIADNIGDPRKGMVPLSLALKTLKMQGYDIHLITVGNGACSDVGSPQTEIGPLRNDCLLSHFYAACDVFVCPSLQDNLPNTVIEALSCGIPSIGFNVGGVPDMISDCQNGFLVDARDPVTGLVEALKKSLGLGRNLQMIGHSARLGALSKFSEVIQASAYSNLYQQMCGQGGY